MRRLFAQWSVLTRFPDFGKLFAGNTISQLGSSITTVALPLTAVLLLDASPAQMGVLGAVGTIPHLVLGLPAGVWIGRLAYRRTVVLADLARVPLLAAIPVLAAFDVLAMWQLYVIVLLAGAGMLFESLATHSYIPRLVGRDHLLSANSATAQSNSVISTVGPALGGALVQALTAPLAIAVNAASFLASGVCKRLVSDPGQPARGDDNTPPGLTADVIEGLRAVFGNAVLRPMVLSAALGALTGQVQNVILMLYLARELNLSATLVGVTIAVSGGASILGAVFAAPITERVGHGPAFVIGQFLVSLGGFVLAAASGPLPLVLATLGFAQFLRGIGPPLYAVNQLTVRQALTTPDLLPRVNATWRFLVFGTQPIGSLIGGGLGSVVGLRLTFVLGSVGMLMAVGLAVWSPLRRFRELPEP